MIDPIRSTPRTALTHSPATPTSAPASGTTTAVATDGFTRSTVENQPLQAASAVNNDSPVATHPRPMTGQEKQMFLSWFPKLDVDKAAVTAEATPRYNCISWTTGNTKSWDWPPSMYPESTPVEAFAHYYRDRGFSPISAEEAAQIGTEKEVVAYWEEPAGPTHGSVAGPSHGDRWESKCGQAARIFHGRDELEGDTYGKIAGYWVKTGEGEQLVRDIPRDTEQRLDTKLALKIVSLDPKLVDRFEEAYSSWQSERSSPALAMSSNPADYLKGEGYQELRSLGKEALPLWISKMRQGDFFCQYAVQELTRPDENRFELKGPDPQPELKAKEVRCSEQDKANQMLVQWLESQW